MVAEKMLRGFGGNNSPQMGFGAIAPIIWAISSCFIIY
jgi:hypothetical protein